MQNCGAGSGGKNWTSWLSVDALWKWIYSIYIHESNSKADADGNWCYVTLSGLACSSSELLNST